MRSATRWQGSDLVGAVYARVPRGVIASTDRVWRRSAALARRRMPVVCFKGPLTETGERGHVAVVNPQPSVMHFVQRIFAEPVEPTPMGGVTWRRLRGEMGRLADEADLVLAHLHGALGRRRLGASCVRVPEAVACRAALPAEGGVPARARRGQQANLRLLRRSALRWDVSHDAADFLHFYQQMYVPFAEHRFGELACIRGAQRLRSHFLHGGLIRVLDGNEWVGGVVYSVEGEALRVWVVGVRDGDADLIKQGVMTANWAFAFEQAQQLGLTHCHMGLSRPTLNDGVLVYKKRWGAALSDRQPTHDEIFARWMHFNPTVRRWLATCPLLFRDEPGLAGLAVVEEQAQREAVERIAIEFVMPGVQRLCIVAPGEQRVQPCEMRDARVRELPVQLVPETSSHRLMAMLRPTRDK